MKINHKDALNILGLSEVEATIESIKTAYRQACSKYHPDRNPAGLEMMKLVNAAYAALEDVLNGKPFDASVKHQKEGTQAYGEELNAALNAIINLGLTIEVCGSWIWVSGDTRPYKEVLKEAGYKWAPKKSTWHFRPSDYKSFSRGKYSMEQIRDKYGSSSVKSRSYNQLEAA